MKITNLIALSLFTVLLFACQQNNESKEILFVCTHGAARSPIAAAYFNKIAKEQNLKYYGVFRGTEPDKILTEGTRAGLTKDDFDVDSWTPEKVSLQDMKKAYKIITFDCALPSNHTFQLDEEQWNGTPSISKDYANARNIIKTKVEELIQTLPKN